jgi:hypothetical protein
VGCADGALLKLAAKSVLLLAFQEKSWERSTLGPVLGEALGVYSLEGRMGASSLNFRPLSATLGLSWVTAGRNTTTRRTGHSATPLGEELGRALGDQLGGGGSTRDSTGRSLLRQQTYAATVGEHCKRSLGQALGATARTDLGPPLGPAH